MDQQERLMSVVIPPHQAVHQVIILANIVDQRRKTTAMQPLIEYTEPPKEGVIIPNKLLNRDEVQQFIKYIEEMEADPTDYTANTWRELIAKPDTLVGFGRAGDWFQYVLQKRSALSFLTKFAESGNKHIQILSAVSLNSGLNPKRYDWDNVVEMYEFDPPQFNVKETRLTFKIILDDDNVTLQVTSIHWDRYSSEGDHTGQCGKIIVRVIQSTEKFKQFNNRIVLYHDVTDVTYDDETPDVPVQLSTKFFTEVSVLLRDSPKESIVNFVFATCQYPFTKCDWTNEIELKEAPKDEAVNLEEKYQHIDAEIREKIPSAAKIFEKGYTNIKDHINLLDYLMGEIAQRARDLYCYSLTLWSLNEDRVFDFSAGKDMLKQTNWHHISDTSAMYSTNVFDAKDQFEFAMQVEIQKELSEYSDVSIKVAVVLTCVEDEKIKKKLRKVFQPYCDTFSECEKGECYIHIWEKDENEDIPFQVKFAVCHFAEHNATELQILREIIKVLHLDWSVNQFWKFLLDAACMDEALSWSDLGAFITHFWEPFLDEDQEAKHYDKFPDEAEEEMFSGESADDGEDTQMDLEQELKDIKMDLTQ